MAEKRAAEKAANPKANKKRPPRKQNENNRQHIKPTNKTFVKKTQFKPKVELNSIDFASLQEGSKVKVKVGDNAKNAVVLEVVKDSAKVELENGLVISVTPDRLFV